MSVAASAEENRAAGDSTAAMPEGSEDENLKLQDARKQSASFSVMFL